MKRRGFDDVGSPERDGETRSKTLGRTPMPPSNLTFSRRLAARYLDLRTRYPVVGATALAVLVCLAVAPYYLTLGPAHFYAIAGLFLALLSPLMVLAPAGPLVRAFQAGPDVRVILEPKEAGKPFAFDSLIAEVGVVSMPLGEDGLSYKTLRPGGAQLQRGEAVTHQTVLLLSTQALLLRASEEGGSPPQEASVRFVVRDCALNEHGYRIRVRR